MRKVRRVVTGLDGEGRSTIIADDDDRAGMSPRDFPTHQVSLLWQEAALPADNGVAPDATGTGFALDPGGARLILWQYPPLRSIPHADQSRFLTNAIGIPVAPGHHPGLHATNSVDWLVLLDGELTLILETSETTLYPGDVLIDRGIIHAWENRGDVPALALIANMDARPLAGMAGATPAT